MSDACVELRLLIVDDGAPASWAPALLSSLSVAGQGRSVVCGVCAADGPLVQTVVREAPQALLWLLGAPDAALPARLDALAQVAALPVLLWPVPDLAPPSEEWVTALAEREAALWWPAPVATDAAAVAAMLPLQLRWQQRRHALARSRQDALDDARQRLDERKWVDRAKGMLMQHQQLSETDAFALLRTASQHANLRVGEISRGLLEAAQAAEAINRGGQLRMLSQRLVKGCALQSGAVAGGARPRSAATPAAGLPPSRRWDAPLIDDSVQRLQANLLHLAGLSALAAVPEVATELQRSQAAWQAVQAALEPAMLTGAAAELLVLDARAEALLEAAEALTAALERASGRRSLRLVNLCGRQRMLSQRLAKQALLSSRCDGEAAALQAAAAVRTLGELESGLRTLEAAPLSTEDIRSALARALGQWQRLRQTLAAPAGAGTGGGGADATALLLARESEALLASFEHLTSLYEHSMQVLLG